MESLIWIAVGAIVLLALVLVLRRLARDNEPVDELVLRLDQKMVHELTPSEYYERYGMLAYRERYGKPAPGGEASILGSVGSWHEQERLRKKRREQERARKRRQKNRKGGRP